MAEPHEVKIIEKPTIGVLLALGMTRMLTRHMVTSRSSHGAREAVNKINHAAILLESVFKKQRPRPSIPQESF